MSSTQALDSGLVAVSGRGGLVGWHLRALLHALGRPFQNVDLRSSLPTHVGLAATAEAIHVSGITRGTDAALREGNIDLARRFVHTLDGAGARPLRVVHANSVQASQPTPYGEGKAGAAQILAEAAQRWGAEFVDVIIENVFGEHGTPEHNTVTSTFCHRLARGLEMPVGSDAERVFVHAQDVAEALAGVIDTRELEARGTRLSIPALADRLTNLASMYDAGEIPELLTAFDRDLLNTYRSFAFDVRPEIPLRSSRDLRGVFTELVRVHGGTGQTGISITIPGITRGDHFHRRKIERFVVISGRARIVTRRVLSEDRRVFDVSGDDPVAIDMPTLWSHSITNTGHEPLITAFWTDDLFDPTRPDTYQDLA